MFNLNVAYIAVRVVGIIFGFSGALLGVICIFGFLLIGHTDNPELVATRLSLFVKLFLVAVLGSVTWNLWADQLK